MMTCSIPAATASSTTYWMAGLSTRGSISFGCALVAGRNRVPSPAAGMTALRTFTMHSPEAASYLFEAPILLDPCRRPVGRAPAEVGQAHCARISRASRTGPSNPRSRMRRCVLHDGSVRSAGRDGVPVPAAPTGPAGGRMVPGDKRPPKRKPRAERERIEYAPDGLQWLREHLEPTAQTPPPQPPPPEPPARRAAQPPPPEPPAWAAQAPPEVPPRQPQPPPEPPTVEAPRLEPSPPEPPPPEPPEQPEPPAAEPPAPEPPAAEPPAAEPPQRLEPVGPADPGPTEAAAAGPPGPATTQAPAGQPVDADQPDPAEPPGEERPADRPGVAAAKPPP